MAACLLRSGVAYLRKGDGTRAIVDFGEAIRLDPSDARALYHRGVAYSRAGDYRLALTDFGKRLALTQATRALI